MNFKPNDKAELLAMDLARELNDPEGISLYLAYANKYPEPVLRGILGRVKEVPIEQIKKSRGALFNYLVKRYAQQNEDNYRN
jgi:hypothetical protein